MKKPLLQSSSLIVLLYVLFGILWIAASVRFIEAVIRDPRVLSILQTYRGWGFILASAFVLYILIQRQLKARGRTAAELKASEEKYRTLIESANDAIFLFDAETRLILEANRRAEELLGLPAERIIGMHQRDLHPPEEREQCRQAFQEALERERSIAGGLCISHSDGHPIWVEISISVIDLAGKRVIQGIFRDITARKQAAEELEKERNKAQLYLDMAGVIIVVIGADQRVSLINRKGAEILGFGEDEIIGTNWFDSYIPEGIRGNVKSVFQKLIRGEVEPVEYFENPVLSRSGEERMIAWHNTILRDGQGMITATLSSGEDITARKQAEGQAQSRLQRLAGLHAVDMIITSSLDLRVTLTEFLGLVISQLRVDAADVLLLNSYTQALEYAAGHGFRTTAIQKSRVLIGEGIAGLAALEQRNVSTPDLRDPASGFARASLLNDEGFIAHQVIPLVAKGQVKGVLEVFHRSPLSLDEEQREFLEALAAQAAIAIDNATLFHELQRSNIELALAYDATLEGWARALDLRSKATERHTERVTEMTLRLAREMGMSEKELVHVRRGSLLHDIGKIGIPDSILLKPDSLTEDEWEIMRRHPVDAFEMLLPIAYLRPALDIPYCHHERWDGTGYPRGLRGDQIPLAARIFAVADVWDAVYAEDRPYRQAMTKENALNHIRSLARTQLDPEIVDVFLKMEW